jgi:hypothetical protein
MYSRNVFLLWFYQVMITYINSGKTTTVVRSSCPLDHVLLFHGRDEATLTFLQRTFDRNLQRAKKLMALAAESKLVFRYTNGSEVVTVVVIVSSRTNSWGVVVVVVVVVVVIVVVVVVVVVVIVVVVVVVVVAAVVGNSGSGILLAVVVVVVVALAVVVLVIV